MNRYIKIGFYILVTVMLAGFVFMELTCLPEREDEVVPGNLLYKGTVVWEKADGTKEQIAVPGNYEVEPGDTMVISTVLPDDYNQETIEIRSSQQNLRFYI
ncbi:MAG: hypothetical protein ACI4LO_02825, partial [Anaerovoracaceae bacterium]